ncbi:MAG: hypothetical protein ACLTV6_14810 [Christensenellales bacterium]
MNKLPFAFPLADDDILRRRATILTALCAADNGFCAAPVQSIRRQTLSQMLNLYDKLFFGGFLSHSYGQIDVTLSQRLISSAGKFIYTRGGVSRMCRAEIRMSGDFLFRLNKGLICSMVFPCPLQEAFLVVFEHELCHPQKMPSLVQRDILRGSFLLRMVCSAIPMPATASLRGSRMQRKEGFSWAPGFAFAIRAAF